jgi:hypothetical protein
MLTFRTSITFAVMTFIIALTGLLIAIQLHSLRFATNEAAAAYMDATSAKVLGLLQGELSAISSLVNVMATSSSVADGQRLRTPSGFEVVMNTNHHLSKPAMVGKLDTTATFNVVWRSISPIKASVWSRFLPDSAKRVANWTYPWVCGGCTEPTYKD